MQRVDSLERLQSIRETWEPVEIGALKPEDQLVFLRRKEAVDCYIDGVPVKEIVERTGICAREIYRYVGKCFGIMEDGNYCGYLALVPKMIVAKKKSHLGELLKRYPDLIQFLRGNYFGEKAFTLENRMSIKTLHAKYIDKCKSYGIQSYEYPLCKSDKGYDDLRIFMRKLEQIEADKAIKRFGKDEQQKFFSTGFGEAMGLIVVMPYDKTQVDGHIIDMQYTVEVETRPGVMQRMPADRMWFLPVFEIQSRCIIDYAVTTDFNYDSIDIVKALRNAIIPHVHKPFTIPGLQYPKEGGFPSERIPEIQWAVPNMIMLDNAKSHLSKNTVFKLVNELKCCVNYGSVSTPETRGIVERLFKTIEEGGFHRLPGTTGSNQRDPVRKNPEKESVEYAITYENICELLEYFVAEYNNSVHSALNGQTPLEALESRIRNTGMLPYILPEEQRASVNDLCNYVVEKTVRGKYEQGNRPNISFESVKYHAADIRLPSSYTGKKVKILVNPDDISHVKLYDENGKFLTTMVAEGEWGRRPHSLQTRKWARKILNKIKETKTSFRPDLTVVEEALKQQAKTSRRARTKAATIQRESPMPERPSTVIYYDEAVSQKAEQAATEKAVNDERSVGFSDDILSLLKEKKLSPDEAIALLNK